MLRGIPPLLTPDLLHAMAAMGHGDTIAIVDANFPATTNARRLVTLAGVSADRVLGAVLNLLPLDDFVPNPAAVMQVVGDPGQVPDIVREFTAILARHGAKPPAGVERHAFYRAAAEAFIIVQTGERRLYGNVIVTKGVLRPADKRGARQDASPEGDAADVTQASVMPPDDPGG